MKKLSSKHRKFVPDCEKLDHKKFVSQISKAGSEQTEKSGPEKKYILLYNLKYMV